MAIYLNKRKVYACLRDEKQILYNYVTNVLIDRILTKKLIPYGERVNIIASRRETNKVLNEQFRSYIEQQSRYNHNANIKVSVKPPQEEKCLQIVDFVCWSLFRKYEYSDNSYADLIKDLVLEENGLFN
jgi:hypothetical protein